MSALHVYIVAYTGHHVYLNIRTIICALDVIYAATYIRYLFHKFLNLEHLIENRICDSNFNVKAYMTPDVRYIDTGNSYYNYSFRTLLSQIAQPHQKMNSRNSLKVHIFSCAICSI